MKINYDKKIEELEKRIRELEGRPSVPFPSYPIHPQPPLLPPYHPAMPELYRCWCGRNYPHTCTWC